MHEIKGIPVADLLLDPENARLADTQASQPAVYVALARELKAQLVDLAKDIVDHGMDPTALTAVIRTDGGRYTVLEGNRRILALKALETPSIVKGGLPPGEQKKLEAQARTYASNPVDDVQCVLFDTEEDAEHWIILRHTSGHGGASLVPWDANEADRYKARKGRGTRDIAGQVIDFVDGVDGAGDSRGIISTLRRILNNKTARDTLGLVRAGDQLSSVYPADEVIKGLRKIVDDLRTKQIRTKHVYDAEGISDYVRSFKRNELPVKSKRLTATVKLAELTMAKPSAPKQKPRTRTTRPRNTLIPRTCTINASGRLNNIYNELLKIDVDSYPNACSVMLRVFVELAVDQEISKRGHLKGKADPNTTLAKRLKELAGDMETSGDIENDLKRAVARIADNARGNLAANTMTLNQFVHNRYVHPQPNELRTAWDELQPFMEAVLK